MTPERGAFLAANPFPNRHTLGLFYREKMAALHALLPRGEAPRRVLEIGGGRSGLTRLCFPEAEIVTVDLDHSELLGMREGERRAQADATRLPFRDASFDCVTMFDVVEHVPDDVAAAREAARVLAPSGCLLVSTPTRRFRYPHFPCLRPLFPTEQEIFDDWGHVRRGYEVGELAGLWPGLGCEDVRHFQNALTVLNHDIAFARWPLLVRRALSAVLLPVTHLGMALQRPQRGYMVALRLRKGATP